MKFISLILHSYSVGVDVPPPPSPKKQVTPLKSNSPCKKKHRGQGGGARRAEAPLPKYENVKQFMDILISFYLSIYA